MAKSIASLRYINPIPEYIRLQNFDTLAENILLTGDKDGLELVERNKIIISNASCSSCSKYAAEARMRLWLSKYIEHNLSIS